MKGRANMNFEIQEMMETIRMVRTENLDIRTVTMGINLRDCANSDFDKMNQKFMIKSLTTQKI